METKAQMRKSLTAAAVATVLVAATPAFAAPTFTINEGSVPGAIANVLVADAINGNFTEVFTATAPGAFATSALFLAGNYVINFDTGAQANVPSQLGSLDLPPNITNGYELYATFSATGTFAAIAGGGFSFTGNTASLELWLDPAQDTQGTPGATGSDPFTFVGAGEDILLGSANSLLAGDGLLNPGIANGNFEIIWGDFALTGPPGGGDAFFVAPRPFHIVLDVNGNFRDFPIGGTDVTSGSANAFFVPVPEPGVLGLLGIALAGLGFSRRRDSRL